VLLMGEAVCEVMWISSSRLQEDIWSLERSCWWGGGRVESKAFRERVTAEARSHMY
jgi:hypothetical protein